MFLTNDNVINVFSECMLSDGMQNASDSKLVEGIISKAIFYKPLLEEKRNDIIAMIDQLPGKFKQTEGGGASFLEMCMDANREQWADHHVVMERLLLLGIAIDYMGFNAPKIMWKVLPGGMPYVFIKNKEFANDKETN